MKRLKLDVTIEELRLAWHRVKLDRPDRCFADHPHLTDWIDHDLDGWLTDLQKDLTAGYVPRSCQTCPVPKAGALMRPGAVLDIRDETVYNLLIGRFFPVIHASLNDFQGDPDIACQLPDSPDDKKWLKLGFLIWKQWRDRSIQKIDDGASYVVISDITGFYDNIDIHRLTSDLRELRDSSAELQLLTECLSKWAYPRGKGIPQGFSASDILAKLYLHPVDRALRNEGQVHLRYVDDYRIFLRSRLDGRSAIAQLSELMHSRGLNLQSAKTMILTKTDAAKRFDGITPIIEDIQDQLITELIEVAGLPADYLPPREISRLLESRKGPAPEVLERTFREYFSIAGDDQFDKTLFHYLLTRLGKAGVKIAVEYCLEALRTRPEETEHILRYFSAIEIAASHINSITQYMKSEDAIYDYQLYQLIRYFYSIGRYSNAVTKLCRSWTHDHNRAQWLRSYCTAYMGEHGDKSDLERMESSYANLGSDIERADCVAALHRMERSRRNAFYGRAEVEGSLVKQAVALSKSRNTGDNLT